MKNKNLQVAEAIFKIILLVILKILFIVPRLIIYVFNIIEKIARVARKTITYLIEQIEIEVIK